MSFEYRMGKEIRFEASHVLNGLPPRHKCSNLHGHSYRAEIELAGKTLDQTGMLIDFGVLNKVRDQLDHKHLNEVLAPDNPTAENVAKWIMSVINQIILELDAMDDVICTRVKVWETHSSWAEFRRVG